MDEAPPRPADLPDDPAALKALVREQAFEIERLKEELRLATHKRFGASSEKADPDQGQLFNEAEVLGAMPPAPEADEITVPAHTRAKGGRKPIDDRLPRERIEHDIPESEKLCPCGSGHLRPRIGEVVTEQADIEPAKVKVVQHVRFKYGPCCAVRWRVPGGRRGAGERGRWTSAAPSSDASRDCDRAGAARHHRRAAARPADPEEHGRARPVRVHRHGEIPGRPAALPAGDDPGSAWPDDLACDVGFLDDPARRADRAADQPGRGGAARLRRAADGRDDGAGAEGGRACGAIGVAHVGAARRAARQAGDPVQLRSVALGKGRLAADGGLQGLPAERRLQRLRCGRQARGRRARRLSRACTAQVRRGAEGAAGRRPWRARSRGTGAHPAHLPHREGRARGRPHARATQAAARRAGAAGVGRAQTLARCETRPRTAADADRQGA